MANERYKDEFTGVETTGHEWDGIRELDNPMPRWWLWTFYACIAWAVVYWVLMPTWPLVTQYTEGVLGYSQREVVAEKRKQQLLERSKEGAPLLAASFAQINADPKMQVYAMAAGRSAFGDNCAPCHGSGAQGAVGYPNLNDDDWLWGGKIEDIHTTIQYGIRGEHDDTRINAMPAFLKDEMLTKQEVEQVSEYVLKISGQEHDAQKAAPGLQLFADNCASCHGDEGKGDSTMGAPNLTDAIWLYRGDREGILQSVSYSRSGVMPAWEDRLDPVTIKSLAIYVHSLGGGE